MQDGPDARLLLVTQFACPEIIAGLTPCRIFTTGLTGMQKEKRTGKSPDPDKLEAMLNEAQLLMLGKMEELGWRLKFIRRPVSEDIVPVLFHPEGSEFGILEDDGSLNTQTNISVRETDQTVLIACPRCGYMVYGRLWRCPGCGGTGSIYR